MTDVDSLYSSSLDFIENLSLTSMEETDNGFNFFLADGTPAGGITTKNPNLVISPAIVRLKSFDSQTRDVLVKDWSRPSLLNPKLSNPGTIPSNQGHSGRWSPDGKYFALMSINSPYLFIYKRSGTSLTKLADPLDLPSNYGSAVGWSHDGKYLAISVWNEDPRLIVYKRSGDTFTKISASLSLPTSVVSSLDWSPQGYYLSVVADSYPTVALYKLDNDVLSKLDDLVDLPSDGGLSLRWSPDGQLLAVGNSGSSSDEGATDPFLYVYLFSGEKLIKLPNIVNGPYTTVRGMNWSPNGRYLAIATFGNSIEVFSRSGNTLTRVAVCPDTISARDTAWTPDGRYLCAVSSSAPYVWVYKMQEPILLRVENLDFPGSPGGVNSAEWSPDGIILGITHDSSPYLSFYKSAMGPVPGVAVRVS